MLKLISGCTGCSVSSFFQGRLMICSSQLTRRLCLGIKKYCEIRPVLRRVCISATQFNRPKLAGIAHPYGPCTDPFQHDPLGRNKIMGEPITLPRIRSSQVQAWHLVCCSESGKTEERSCNSTKYLFIRIFNHCLSYTDQASSSSDSR
jgi:hypothetical protein